MRTQPSIRRTRLRIAGLVAHSVSRRVKEIGIRIELGARPRPQLVLIPVLRRFLKPVAAGLIAGALGAGGIARFVRSELHGVSNPDPIGYARGTKVLRVDPLSALRN